MPIDPRVLALEKASESMRRAGDHPGAIAKIHEALAIDPKFVRGHLALAVLYHHTGELELAVGHAERACEIEPGDSFNFAALSVTCQRAFEATRDPEWIHRAESAMARSRGVG